LKSKSKEERKKKKTQNPIYFTSCSKTAKIKGVFGTAVAVVVMV